MFMFVTGVPGAISAGFLLDKFKKFKVIGLITSILGTNEHKLNQFQLKLQNSLIKTFLSCIYYSFRIPNLKVTFRSDDILHFFLCDVFLSDLLGQCHSWWYLHFCLRNDNTNIF